MSFCSHCGGNLAFDRAPFCAHCGKPQGLSLSPIAIASAPARAPEPPKEQTFFDDAAATVTSTRFIVPGQTFPIAGITSIANVKEPPKWGAPVVLILLGLVLGFNSSVALGLFFVIPGVIWCALLKTKHSVLLRTAGGEVKALSSINGEFIDEVVMALNQAIVHRN